MSRKVSMTTLFVAALICIGSAGAMYFPSNTPTRRAISPPGCQKLAPKQKNLTEVITTNTTVPNEPFGIVYATQQANIAFVATGAGLVVLDTSEFKPKFIHRIELGTIALGVALTHSGLYLLIAAGADTLIIIDTAKAASGHRSAILNRLKIPSGHGSGVIEVTISKDDRYAFVSQEYSGHYDQGPGSVNVFKLNLPVPSNGTASGAYIDYLALGEAVVGSALSLDEEYLYVASEVERGKFYEGSVSVLSVKTLKTKPRNALLATVEAGCNPTRLIAGSDGLLWVTARASNKLLAFNTTKLLSNKSAALVKSIQVGELPDSLIFFKDENYILLANSNRFGYPHATAGLGVVNARRALRDPDDAYIGQIPTGFFPREFAISPDGSTILVSVWGSNEVQAVDVKSIP